MLGNVEYHLIIKAFWVQKNILLYNTHQWIPPRMSLVDTDSKKTLLLFPLKKYHWKYYCNTFVAICLSQSHMAALNTDQKATMITAYMYITNRQHIGQTLNDEYTTPWQNDKGRTNNTMFKRQMTYVQHHDQTTKDEQTMQHHVKTTYEDLLYSDNTIIERQMMNRHNHGFTTNDTQHQDQPKNNEQTTPLPNAK